MPVLIGPFDPIALTLNVLNTLMKKGLISFEEAREIIRASLDPSMPDAEKEKVVSSMVRRV